MRAHSAGLKASCSNREVCIPSRPDDLDAQDDTGPARGLIRPRHRKVGAAVPARPAAGTGRAASQLDAPDPLPVPGVGILSMSTGISTVISPAFSKVRVTPMVSPCSIGRVSPMNMT